MRYANRNYKKLNSSLVDTFLRYHDDAENYRNQEVNYDELYDRLSKYAKPGENPEDMNVDELFVRATPAEQASMVRLISPANWDDNFDDELNSACNKRKFDSNRGSLNSSYNSYEDVQDALFDDVWQNIGDAWRYIIDNSLRDAKRRADSYYKPQLHSILTENGPDEAISAELWNQCNDALADLAHGIVDALTYNLK